MVDPTTKPSLGFRGILEWIRWLLSGLIAFLDESEMNKEWMKSSFWTLPLLHLSTGISGAQTMEFTIYYLLFTAYWLSWGWRLFVMSISVTVKSYFYLPSVA